MNHIRRAAQPWVCAGCNGPIEKGSRHFCELGMTLPYGRYIGTMVESRWHIYCAPVGQICCKEGDEQLDAAKRQAAC